MKQQRIVVGRARKDVEEWSSRVSARCAKPQDLCVVFPCRNHKERAVGKRPHAAEILEFALSIRHLCKDAACSRPVCTEAENTFLTRDRIACAGVMQGHVPRNPSRLGRALRGSGQRLRPRRIRSPVLLVVLLLLVLLVVSFAIVMMMRLLSGRCRFWWRRIRWQIARACGDSHRKRQYASGVSANG